MRAIFLIYTVLVLALSCKEEDEAPAGTSLELLGMWSGQLLGVAAPPQKITFRFFQDSEFSITSQTLTQATGIFNHFKLSETLIFDVQSSNLHGIPPDSTTTFTYKFSENELQLTSENQQFYLKKSVSDTELPNAEGRWQCLDKVGNKWFLDIGIANFSLLINGENQGSIAIAGTIKYHPSVPGQNQSWTLKVEKASPATPVEVFHVESNGDQESENQLIVSPQSEDSDFPELKPIICNTY